MKQHSKQSPRYISFLPTPPMCLYNKSCTQASVSLYSFLLVSGFQPYMPDSHNLRDQCHMFLILAPASRCNTAVLPNIFNHLQLPFTLLHIACVLTLTVPTQLVLHDLKNLTKPQYYNNYPSTRHTVCGLRVQRVSELLLPFSASLEMRGDSKIICFAI